MMNTLMSLQVIWWLLIGVVFVGVGVMVGMDMGVGILLFYLGRNEAQRRVPINIIGSHWDGNQVWFILGGGAVFAAFPLVYATAFSGFYIVMLLLLWSLIVRPLAFEYRRQRPGSRWRRGWDWMFLLSGLVPMLVFGAAIGNVLRGVPFHFDWNLRSHYSGSFLGLLHPFALLCGLLSVALACYIGSAIIVNGSEGDIQQRARRSGVVAAGVAGLLFAIGGVWVRSLPGYLHTGGAAPGLPQIPLQQQVSVQNGAWLTPFEAHPWLWALPMLAFAGLAVGGLAIAGGRGYLAWWLGVLAWLGVIATVGAASFPFLLPSSSNPAQSLTIWNASSSCLTLSWMLAMALIFVPLVIWYTSWSFHVMRGKVSVEQVANDKHAY